MNTKHYKIFILFPLIFLVVITSIFGGLNFLGFEAKKTYNIFITNQQKLDLLKNKKIIDYKTSNKNLNDYFLTNSSLVIVNNLKEVGEINFLENNIKNVSSFGVDNQGFIYIGTKDGLIYKFDPNFKIIKPIAGVSNEKDGYGDNGYYCINDKFGEIGDIIHYKTDVTDDFYNQQNKYCKEELENCRRKFLFIFDKTKKEVITCNHGFGPGKLQLIKAKIDNPKFFIKGFAICNNDGICQVLKGNFNSWNKKTKKEGDIFTVKNVKGKFYTEYPLDYKGNDIYFKQFKEKFGKEADIIIHRQHILDKLSKYSSAEYFNTLVTYKNEPGIYLVKYDISVKTNIFVYIQNILGFIKYSLIAYILFVYIFIVIYYSVNKNINNVLFKILFLTNFIFFIFLFLPNPFTEGLGTSSSDAGIGALIQILVYSSFFVGNIILSFILSSIIKFRRNKF